MGGLTCFESNRDIKSPIYEPNGSALTVGEIVDLVNGLTAERDATLDDLELHRSIRVAQGSKIRKLRSKNAELAKLISDIHHELICNHGTCESMPDIVDMVETYWHETADEAK